MSNPKKPTTEGKGGAHGMPTPWRLRIGRALLILTGIWLVLWVVGYGVLYAASGTLNSDPMLGNWLSVQITPESHIGILSGDYPQARYLPPAPPKLMVLFDLGGLRSVAYYAPFSAQKVVVIPAWTPPLIPFGLACLFLIRWREPAPNTCRSCGYNLTGNVSGRCPECGRPVHQRGPASR